jgi:hypothetical protein
MFAFIGTASTHHSAMMAPQAPHILQVLVSNFDNYSAGPNKNGGVSQNSIWATGKLLMALARTQHAMVGDPNVWSVVLQQLLSIVVKYHLSYP